MLTVKENLKNTRSNVMSIENASGEKSSSAWRSRPVLLPSVFPARSLILLVACLLTASTVNAQSKNASEYTKHIDSFIDETLREKKIPGVAVGIVEDGRLVYARGFGVMKVGDTSKPVTAETLFHMASVTKPFVATAVMQLVEQDKVDLNAPVTKYLPYFRLKDPRFRFITVRQLLTHTSGMPDVEDYLWDKPEYDDGSLERYVRSLTDKDLRWQPGSQFAYSNMA
jgi:CubicO group peptidase (beta-lactamase class C family)